MPSRPCLVDDVTEWPLVKVTTEAMLAVALEPYECAAGDDDRGWILFVGCTKPARAPIGLAFEWAPSLQGSLVVASPLDIRTNALIFEGDRPLSIHEYGPFWMRLLQQMPWQRHVHEQANPAVRISARCRHH